MLFVIAETGISAAKASTEAQDGKLFILTLVDRALQVRCLPSLSSVRDLPSDVKAQNKLGRAMFVVASALDDEESASRGTTPAQHSTSSNAGGVGRPPTPTLLGSESGTTRKALPSTSIRRTSSSATTANIVHPGTTTTTTTTGSTGNGGGGSDAHKNALKRMIVTSLKLRGIDKTHGEFKDLYNHTLQAATFALRRVDDVLALPQTGQAHGQAGQGKGMGVKERNALWERKAVVHVENLLQMFLS